MSFNKIILVGNCTKDGEFKYTSGGSAIYNNSIATSRKFTQNGEKREEVCFVDFTAFSRVGEICNQYLRKGSKILVEGRLNFDQWVDQNGQKRSKHSVVVETMQMLDSKGDAVGSVQPQQNPQAYQQPPVDYQNPSGQSMSADDYAKQQQSYQQPGQPHQQMPKDLPS